MSYDVIIIGGGPSGLMAAIAASGHGARTLLIDKSDKLGRKLGISGGGRCNVTNAKDLDELIKHIPGNGRFLHSALAAFSNRDIIAYFEGMGIRLKEEDRGRMFPVSDKAKTVVDALVNRVRNQGVAIRVNTPVRKVLYKDGRVAGVELAGGERVMSRAVVLATGGKSVPHTGSTGDGYAWAEEAGHTITELYPTEVPLLSREAFIQSKELQGLSLRDITVSVWNPKGKKIVEHEGDLLFTHFGISGPTALRCSQFIVKTLKQFDVSTVKITIDLFPEKSVEEVYADSLQLARNEPKKAIKNILKGLLPERMIPIILKKSGLKEETTFDNIPKQPWSSMASLVKAFPMQISGTLSIEEAFVTGGGVHLKEIDPKTMHSKVMDGLFFCGEILDVHGYTGGYNITAAFTTGYTAGMSASQIAQHEL
ncbi:MULTISPECIES: NAD(P)/FAD-dependent oxidoreductase [unclassified Paenibacillus]|uniref:NAD(P)/FAD-dependent oxidoreductase n=1 Tax=unclassified Paenibacillus TaxID=185978 RepID=UPI001AE935C4|nr:MULTISPECIES: NAD(P)/FAD-dependent oxidoreductase [unclassified Paenibacillus]MBP1157559.1 putative Rossmann fold flavoprotein [Paenibacillus sp. PvP091]MBP1171704.1 putative Rossmann fold flavoprotein [Paenibacillus sp. PvR098]MBP2438085.1 putative Rossmann fold flavoprotein [Paenibacillus sp. PvP052]